MAKKIGVLLSGCGVMDGSEIHEAVLTLLSIEKEGHEAICFAPNKNQTQVINHISNKPINSTRNMLEESARIARGKIKDIKDISANDLDAIILPGGFGAALNLSTFGIDGENAKILPEVESLIKEMHRLKKPIGAICIAPNIIAKVIGKNVELTIGNDLQTANNLEKLGAKHINTSVGEMVFDKNNLIVSTAAYMLAKNLVELECGISKLVRQIIDIINKY